MSNPINVIHERGWVPRVRLTDADSEQLTEKVRVLASPGTASVPLAGEERKDR